jgi:CBS domain-containing protein
VNCCAGIGFAALHKTLLPDEGGVMEQVCDVMTRDVRVVSPKDSMQRAAQCMDELNIGVVPVCDGEKLLGVVTDRDIAVRGVAAGKSPERTPVTEVMSEHVRWCYEDQPIDEVLDEMSDTQIRRMPVVDRDKHLVGIVSLGDLAARGGDGTHVAQALRDISTPSQPDRA